MDILVVDFGSQYTHLIYHKAKYYMEDEMFNVELIDVNDFTNIVESVINGDIKYNCIILSGGPDYVESGKSNFNWKISQLPTKVIGICYGAQMMAIEKDYKFENKIGEYGKTTIYDKHNLFIDSREEFIVWMSHKSFILENSSNKMMFVEYTKNDEPVSWQYSDYINNIKYPRIGLQYHPEVDHTIHGLERIYHILHNDTIGIYFQEQSLIHWSMRLYNELKNDLINNIKEDDRLYLALSGGVDSSTLALLLSTILKPEQLCFYVVDNGLMRKNEIVDIMEQLSDFLPNKCLNLLNKGSYFIEKLKGVIEPEIKRKIIGKCFIDVFTEAIEKDLLLRPVKGNCYFVQGTIYPDVIESGKTQNSKVIKSHHNVGGLPETLPCKLLEPFRHLYKNDVRMIGKLLQLPDHILHRHPFPGPGLAIRILEDITSDKIKIVQEADWIFRREIANRNINTWQTAVILLPIQTVGVKGDNRSYEKVIALRAVDSNNGMTAEPSKINIKDLIDIGNIIQQNVEGINRVVYDLSSKPPATIEWE